MHSFNFRFIFLLLVCSVVGHTQQQPPGHVDPMPVLDAVSKAMGVDQLNCISISGTGYSGMVGQNITQNTDWPPGEPLNHYSRTINYEEHSSYEQFNRKPGLTPRSWKYGTGWRGGTPLQQHEDQTFVVAGSHAWHRDGKDSKPIAAPSNAETWQLDIWTTPHGFVKAARMPGANPVAIWRWELGESGRDGATTGGIERVIVLSATVLGKYRVNATVNSRNFIQRTQTRVPNPVLGDMNYEHEYSAWQDIGDGIWFPAGWHHHDGWDDERKVPVITGGHNSFGGSFPEMKANDCSPVQVPAVVKQASIQLENVDAEKITAGVWLLGGSSHNSVAIEFEDFITVVEAPVDEHRSLSVIEEIRRKIPDKPIRFLLNTHTHFDHLGGLRTYLHIGATIITHQRNRLFLESELLNYVPRMLKPDMVSLYPPTEISEGYTVEDVDEKYILSDGMRDLEIYYVQGLGVHAEGMLLAYLPTERILIEADLYNPGLPLAQQPRPLESEQVLLRNILQNRMLPTHLVPIHGQVMSWEAFLKETQQKP